MAKIRFGKYTWNLPESRLARLVMGVVLIILGMFGFLPVLGFWMIPLGFLILANDVPAVRRMNRRVAVAVKRWWTGTQRKANGSSKTAAAIRDPALPD